MMKFVSFILYSFLSSVSYAELSHDVFDISPYKEKKFGRQLAGTNCDSTSDVSCVFLINGGADEIPCSENFLIRKSDCTALNQKIPVPIKISWKYCNAGENGSGVQVPIKDAGKVNAKYKNTNYIQSKQWTLPNVAPGDCVTYNISPNLNLCRGGVAMSMKYEATIPTVSGSYCYAYKFLRVRKQLIPEDKPAKQKRICAMTSQIRCRINEGIFKDEQCAGNLLKPTPAQCNSGPQTTAVKWIYQYCNFSRLPGATLSFVKNNTFSKLKGATVGMNKSDLTLGCRILEVEDTINRCDTDTFAEQRLRAKLPGDGDNTPLCKQYSKVRIKPHRKCDYKFIFTEVVHNKPKKGSFFEIYSPNCPGETIGDYFQIIKYQGKRQPSGDIIDLKGLTLDKNGFLVFCMTGKVEKLYATTKKNCDHITGIFSPADSKPGDTLAIIKGRVTDVDPYVVLDTFGDADTGKGPDFSSPRRRCSRKPSQKGQNYPVWDVTHFACRGFTNNNAQNIGIDFGWWIGHSTRSPDASPTKAPTKAPTTGTSAPVKAPKTSEPTSKPNSAPSATCDYRAVITEIVQHDDKIVFMEVKATKQCAYDKVIDFNLFLGLVNQAPVNLNGFRFDKNGYIVVCNPTTKMVDDEKCTVKFDFQKPTDKKTIRVQLRTTDIIWDRFGYLQGPCGQDGRKNVCMDNVRSRAVRVVTVPNTKFLSDEWRFFDLGSMTPGEPDFFPPTKAPSTDSRTPTIGKGSKGDGKNDRPGGGTGKNDGTDGGTGKNDGTGGGTGKNDGTGGGTGKNTGTAGGTGKSDPIGKGKGDARRR